MSLMQKAKRRMKKIAEDPSALDLSSTVHLDYIRRIAERSSTPSIVIHFETIDEAPQQIGFAREKDGSGRLLAQMTHTTAQATNIQLYGIASYAKVLVNAAFSRLVHCPDYSKYRVSWDSSACDLFNDLRRTHSRPLIKRLWGNPTLRQLLSHVNGFAPMNRYLFAPDGGCLMTEEDFLLDAPLIAEHKYKTLYPDRGWQEYSNGNHIFAALLLQEILNTDIHGAMKELLFDPLCMSSTFFSKTALTASQFDPVASPGFRISPTTEECVKVPLRYLNDAIESSSVGARSSLEDIVVFNRELLKSVDGDFSGVFPQEAIKNIFVPEYKFVHDGSSTLAGLFADTDTAVPGEESSNNELRKCTNVESYRLGKRSNGSLCTFYYKGGASDGFAISVYLLLKDRTFLAVMCNSSGPLDPTDHIARYILHQAFDLRRKVNVLGQADRELALASTYIRSVMKEYNLENLPQGDLAHLTGSYKHIRYSQTLHVDNVDGVVISGSAKRSSAFRAVLVDTHELLLHLRADQMVNETWVEWRNLRFSVQPDGSRGFILVGNDGKDVYRKT